MSVATGLACAVAIFRVIGVQALLFLPGIGYAVVVAVGERFASGELGPAADFSEEIPFAYARG